jgi:hypothetical protein
VKVPGPGRYQGVQIRTIWLSKLLAKILVLYPQMFSSKHHSIPPEVVYLPCLDKFSTFYRDTSSSRQQLHKISG